MTVDTAVHTETPPKEAHRSAQAAEQEVVRLARGPIDVPLLAVTLALTSLGVVMIYSASSVVAELRYGDPNYFLNRQLMGVGMGLVALVVGMRVDYRWYRRLVYPMLAACFALLAAVWVPGLGVVVNNARRWLSVGGFQFQPVEVVKIGAIIYLAYSISKKDDKMASFSLAFIPHLAVIGGLVVLLLPQPDFGSSAVLMAMLGMMLFLGGARISYLVAFALGAAVLAYDAIVSSPYRLERWLVYLNPESYAQTEGWQINESFIALGAGGIDGLGLGEGHLKLGYVPELWNDFIAAIIGHELGLVGLGAVAVLYLVFLWRGVRVALVAKDSFGSFLAFGLTVVITLQAATNLGVVTGLLPTKGLTLPFVSYGRTSIVVCLFAVGVLLNIHQGNEDLWEDVRARREQARLEKEMAKRRARYMARLSRGQPGRHGW